MLVYTSVIGQKSTTSWSGCHYFALPIFWQQ